jgi:two-component system phosphate regulon sensor histidine kinase PhoR
MGTGTETATETPTATAQRASSGTAVGREPRGARFRLAPYFLVLVLPLALGTWAFANYAASNARDRADARLDGSLAAASTGYGAELTAKQVEAHNLARSQRVQLAIVRRDRRELARIASSTDRVAFFAGGHRLAGRTFADAPQRRVVIKRHRRPVGVVVAYAPFDNRLVARLRRGPGFQADDRIAIAANNEIVAGAHRGAKAHFAAGSVSDVRVDGDRYRAAAVRLIRGQNVQLAVLRPRENVTASEWHARRRVLLAGLAVLLGVGVIAYALAPVFARARLAHQQRVQAADVLSHVGDGVFLVDPDGKIRFWNPAAEEITGVQAEAVVGRKPDDVFRRWGGGRPETGFYEVGGREFWLSLSVVESPIGTVYAFRDRTDEYRLEEARADFVATVSHELRTPLASIHGAANTLRERDDLSAPRRRQLLEIVYEQSERLAQLVDQILLANQIDSGSVHLERTSFDGAAVARSTVEAVRPALPSAVKVGVTSADGVPPALGDAEKTRRVLLNLIENAIKYSPAGGRIEVAVASSNGHVRFSVRDEGLGIPADEQERIFEKFYRLDPGMTRGVGGSGLGLFIARQLVELMGGRLGVSSRPGVGSTFSFELPRAEAA